MTRPSDRCHFIVGMNSRHNRVPSSLNIACGAPKVCRVCYPLATTIWFTTVLNTPDGVTPSLVVAFVEAIFELDPRRDQYWPIRTATVVVFQVIKPPLAVCGSIYFFMRIRPWPVLASSGSAGSINTEFK